MSIFIPTAAAGNSLCLATFGRSGELMGFFYPGLDFAQNIREGMPAVRVVDGDHAGTFLWCFDEGWSRTQSFQSASNVVTTRLAHRHFDLSVELTDVVPPGQPVLLRRIVLTHGPQMGRVQFMHYFRMALGDVDYRNGLQTYPEHNAVVQQFRDIAMCVSADRPILVQCGSIKEPGNTHVKQAMVAGHLGTSPQSIGRVEFAVGFQPADEPRWEGMLVMAGGADYASVMPLAQELASEGFEAALRRANERVTGHLNDAGACPLPEFDEAFERAVISLHDLYDETEGTFIAAPEFDLSYELSGGYGYCWPRDAAVCAMAAQRIGRPDMARRFFEWSARTQLPSGHWFQRYWLSGAHAPSWCVYSHQIQLDQTCAIVHAAGVFARRSGTSADAFIASYHPVVEKAVAAILEHLDDNGLHRPASDLWENSLGSFAYTQAGVIAALREADEVFGIRHERTSAAFRDQLRDRLIETFWQPSRQRWLRRISPEGHPDPTLDSSVMGLLDPWEVLDPTVPEERALAMATLNGVSQDLRSSVKGGGAILRFENESYVGGGPGCVNTLWHALCRLRIATTASDPQERDDQIDLALDDLRIALANTSPTGQLPELIPKIDYDYWAAPHAWACSLLIEAVAALRAISERSANLFDRQRSRVRRRAPSH